jgi:isopentenyl-diphosphate delta-isomerase
MELVVLLDEDGYATGTADKAEVHHQHTPLHLAFSAYVFDPAGRFLLTRRALHKRTWPGVWTNSCCGHPGPDEPMADAVRRRLRDELGVEVGEVDLVLPKFRYRAVMSDGIVENEMCPVYRAVTSDDPRPDPAEVMAYQWSSWPPAGELSPWATEQIERLADLGPVPEAWPVADSGELPPAVVR